MDKVVLLQSYFRSKKVREKVLMFSRLPSEIWNIIVCYVRHDVFELRMNRIIYCRISRLYWTCPRKYLQLKMHTLTLAKKCICILDVNTQEHLINFCLRLLQHKPSNTISLHINSILELYYDKQIYKKRIV